MIYQNFVQHHQESAPGDVREYTLIELVEQYGHQDIADVLETYRREVFIAQLVRVLSQNETAPAQNLTDD